LIKVTLFLIQKTNLQQSVDFTLVCKGVRQDRVLEVVDRLIDLVRLSEDDAKLVQHL
jgi:ABC-type taurine transport system ATPase subunit